MSLALAVFRQDLAAVKLLLADPATDVNAVDNTLPFRYSPLWITILHGPGEIFNVLIEDPRVDVNCDPIGVHGSAMNALDFLAYGAENEERFRRLLNRRADARLGSYETIRELNRRRAEYTLYHLLDHASVANLDEQEFAGIAAELRPGSALYRFVHDRQNCLDECRLFLAPSAGFYYALQVLVSDGHMCAVNTDTGRFYRIAKRLPIDLQRYLACLAAGPGAVIETNLDPTFRAIFRLWPEPARPWYAKLIAVLRS